MSDSFFKKSGRVIKHGGAVCGCIKCLPPDEGFGRMVVCSICGNKRCPHANDHNNACTKSNATGQKGSAYE